MRLLTAIFFTTDNKAKKYRNIAFTKKGLTDFKNFARKNNAKYINYYDKETREFVSRVNLE